MTNYYIWEAFTFSHGFPFYQYKYNIYCDNYANIEKIHFKGIVITIYLVLISQFSHPTLTRGMHMQSENILH